MCAVFALGVASGERRFGTMLGRQVAYQAGKATAYLFIGALLLVAGRWWDAGNPVMRVQSVIGLVVGGGMIALGLANLTEWRPPVAWTRWWQGSAACGAVAGLWRTPSLGRSVLTGWVNGFLPCGLSLMALLYLVGTNSAETLVVGTYVFGLGTTPALVAIAWGGNRWSASRRRALVRWGGALLIVMGGLTLFRGNEAVHGWMHRHLMVPLGASPGHEHHAP